MEEKREMAQLTQMRSQPKQERGARRIQRILDAAEQAFAERGYEAVTTNEIAARARTSIGTLYRFFPNKEAIVVQLSERYGKELHQLHEEMFTPVMETIPLSEMIDRLVDPIVALKVKHLGLVSLFVGPNAALNLPTEFRILLDESIQSLETLFTKRFASISTDRCHLYAIIVFQIRAALLSLAFSSPVSEQEKIVAELKTNLFRYLESLD